MSMLSEDEIEDQDEYYWLFATVRDFVLKHGDKVIEDKERFANVRTLIENKKDGVE